GFAGRVKGTPVAIVPERGTLIVGGDGDLALLGRLLDTAEREASASPRYLSTALYCADERGVVMPFEVPPEHPLAARVRHAQHLLAGTEYTHQSECLEAQFAKSGTDIFVGTYGTVTDPDGIERSFTTWAEQVDGLLPRVDTILFGLRAGIDQWEP